MIKILNINNLSHRDIHTKNLFYDNNILYLIDYEFLTQENTPINKCYDLTGTNLESPMNSNKMHVFSNHNNSIKTFLSHIGIEIEDFIN